MGKEISYLAPLSDLYSGVYAHSGIPLSNYQDSEVISYAEPNELLALQIPIRASTPVIQIDAFQATGPETLEPGWSAFLLKSFEKGQGSGIFPDAANLYNDREGTMVILSISDLGMNRHYRVWFRMLNRTASSQWIQIGAIGRGALTVGETVRSVPMGISNLEVSFSPREAQAQIYLHGLEWLGLVRVLDIELKESDPFGSKKALEVSGLKRAGKNSQVYQ